MAIAVCPPRVQIPSDQTVRAGTLGLKCQASNPPAPFNTTAWALALVSSFTKWG